MSILHVHLYLIYVFSNIYECIENIWASHFYSILLDNKISWSTYVKFISLCKYLTFKN